jgi:dCMP deaminase
MDGCTIYVTLFPCNECAKLIIQNGITEVVYLTDKHADKPATKASKLMLDSARVKYWQLKSEKQFSIEFEDVEARALRSSSP